MIEQDPFKKMTQMFLQDETDYLALSKAVKEFKAFLIELTGINLEDEEGRRNIQFDNGIALGTTWAAMCIDDMIRTKRFMKGVFDAVTHLRTATTAPIHILYAGTGPFAALVLPLLTKFSEEEIQFTFLEINEKSFTALERLIAKLGIDGYIRSLELADATQYSIPKGEHFDMLVCEAMLPGLNKEQQVPILLNLLKQLPAGITFIPQKIELELALIHPGRHIEVMMGNTEIDYCKRMGKIFELSKEKVFEYNSNRGASGKIVFPETTIACFPVQMKDHTRLVILTDIYVFGEQHIGINESGLTIPVLLQDISNIRDREIVIRARYKVDDIPGIEYTIHFEN